MPWVIARASFHPSVTTSFVSEDIINGQNDVINRSNYNYAGPFTDDLLGFSRNLANQDTIHFSKVGNQLHANRWFNQLKFLYSDEIN